MSDAKNVNDPHIDACKMRIEELDRNYFSLRDIEWRLALEFLTGYGAIAVAIYHLHKEYPNSSAVRCGPAAIVALLFAIYVFMSVKVQERLHYSRNTKNAYVDKVHELTVFPKIETPDQLPCCKNWYAFVSQLVVHVIVAITVIIYAFAA